MKRGIAILSVLPFLAAACLQGAPGGAGAGLGTPAPFESGGMAGPPAGSSSMSGAAGGSGPSGGSGPGGDDEVGRGDAPSDGPSDPTAGAETPITVVGTPMGGSRKPRRCQEPFRLCFHDVKIAPRPAAAEGPVTYDVSGFLGLQHTPGGPIDPEFLEFLYLIDLAFPENDWTTSTAEPDANFVATVVSPPGRDLRLEYTRCKHTTTLDVTLPKASDPPLVLDPCGSTEPTDVGPPPPPPWDTIKLDQVFELKAQ